MNYKDKMKQAMASIQAQGQGVCQFQIIFRKDVPELFRGANLGDKQALHTLVMLRQALVDMSNGPPALCLLCDHKFPESPAPACFVLFFAAVNDPCCSIVSPLCQACAAQPQLNDRVTQSYKDTIVPGLRVLPLSSMAGRA